MIVGVVKETFPGEKRVALVPGEIARLAKRNHSVMIESGAGVAAGYPDSAYAEKGAQIVNNRNDVLSKSDVLVQVRSLGTNPDLGRADLSHLKKGAVVIGFCDPLMALESAQKLAETGVSAFAMELVPRITRAQAMDALSSQANLAGYKSVLLAAEYMPRIFPMMMTAAGTIAAARVFVLGVGVAGLQAIATAKRLGAVVEAYDIRPEVKDQVVSVGGKFVELPLETGQAGDGGGYAKQQSADFYKRQQELLAVHIRHADAVITTAAVPGRRAPILVTKAMLEGAKPGGVLIDLAAESGGNCELTRVGEVVDHAGFKIVGPTNVPSTVSFHASQLYARNVTALIELISEKDGALKLKLDDEVVAGTLLCHGGEIVHPRVRAARDTAKQESA
jgi:H+-translocating NAD(P) transhydrogenase subunit alpha